VVLNLAAKSTTRRRFVLTWSSAWLAASVMVNVCRAASEQPLPAPAEVTRKLIEHSHNLAATDGGPRYIYPKRTLIEHLDSSSQATDSEERLYEVTLIGGVPLNRLLKITSREMTPDELRAEQEREERFQQHVSSMDPKKMVARREGLVSAELLDHFQFTVSKRIQLNGRTTLVVDFKPKDNPDPPKSIRDRVLNRVAGTLWVDEQDWELAKASAQLTETISMGWFGLLGSLSQCQFTLDRQRLPDDIWVNTKQLWALQFRRLTSTTRIRVTESSKGFRRVEPK
jgi:hypothetical protein